MTSINPNIRSRIEIMDAIRFNSGRCSRASNLAEADQLMQHFGDLASYVAAHAAEYLDQPGGQEFLERVKMSLGINYVSLALRKKQLKKYALN